MPGGAGDDVRSVYKTMAVMNPATEYARKTSGSAKTTLRFCGQQRISVGRIHEE